MRLHDLRRALLIVTVISVASGNAAADSPDEIYAFASHLHKDGLLEAAAQQYLKFARENPRDPRAPDALFNAADCLADAESSDQAITVLETIVSTYPDHPEQCRYHVQLGRLLYKIEEYERADRVFTSVVVTMPECSLVPDALLGKAEAMISMKRHAAAAEVLQNLLDNYIESSAAPRASYDLAFCYRQTNRDNQALRAYEQIVVQFPGDPLAGFAALEAARMHAERGDIDRAIANYVRAREFGTTVFAVPAGMEGGDLLVSAGRYAEALRWYEELLARPDIEDRRAVHIRAVEAAYDAGEYSKVRELAAQYDESYPGTFSPQITYKSALAALQSGDYDDALEAAGKLEAFAPGTEWARSSSRIRGEAMLGKGRPQEAVDEFSLFVSVSGDSTAKCDVLREISRIAFVITKDTTTAIDALERLLDIEQRRFPEEMLQVASTKERSARFQDARRAYADLMRRFPLSDEAEQASLRVAYLDEFTVSDYGGAAKSMDRAAWEIATGPRSEAMLRLLDARIHVTKNFQGALRMCEQLKKSEKGKPAYADVLYFEGLCYSKLARRSLGAAHAGEDENKRAREDAREYAKKASKSWDELISKNPDATRTPVAAFGLVTLRAAVEGELDTKAARSVIARYPKHPRGAHLMEAIGDQFYGRGGKENLAHATTYYSNALQLDKGNKTLQLKRAMSLAQQGNSKDALQVFERISRDGQTRDALKASYEAGRSLRRLQRYKEAIPHFERVSAADPSGAFGANASLQAADCLYLQRNYKSALIRYESVLRNARTEQRKWETTHRMAMCYKQLGEYEESLTLLVVCIRSDKGGSHRARAYEDAAEVAGILGNTSAQVTILEAYTEEFQSGDAAILASKKLTRLYLRRGEGNKSYALARWLVDSSPREDPEPRALVAMSLYRLGKPDEAARERREVVKIAGAESEIVKEIGVEAARHQYDIKQYSAAAESIRPYAESCRGEGVCEEAKYLYAMSLLAARDLDRGTSAAQAFFRDYPLSANGPSLHLRLGNALATANRTNESLLHYDEAAKTASDSSVAYLALKNLGVSYQKVKRWGEAEQVWSRMLQRFPDSQYSGEAALNGARCRMEQGDYRGAITAYTEALPLLDSESRARAFYWMGTSYEQLQDYQAAVVEYLKVPYLASGGGMWVVTAQLKAAECYLKIERAAAAREIYNKVIRAHGATSNWGKIAQKGLDEMSKTVESGAGGGEQ